jgi:hypothetical protein
VRGVHRGDECAGGGESGDGGDWEWGDRFFIIFSEGDPVGHEPLPVMLATDCVIRCRTGLILLYLRFVRVCAHFLVGGIREYLMIGHKKLRMSDTIGFPLRPFGIFWDC